MKKSTVALPTLVCVGVAVGLPTQSMAQPAKPSYSEALALSKQNIQTKHYEPAEEEARSALASAQTPEETGDALMLLGEVLFDRKMYKEARLEWNKAALSDPDDKNGFAWRAHYAIASSHQAEGNPEEAIAEYRKVLAINDADSATTPEEKEDKKNARSGVSLILAGVYYDSRKYELAREQFNQVFKSSGDNDQLCLAALMGLSRVDFIQKNYKEALSESQQLVNIKGAEPEFKELAQKQIEVLTSLPPLEEKVKQLNQEVDGEDDNPLAYIPIEDF